MIPSMLLRAYSFVDLQPIVENALKPGLRTKQGERKLNISFTLEEKEEQTTMQITIEDNGIGRKASAELNKDRKQHQSFATKSIDNRIKIINTTALGFEKMKMETMDVMEDSVALGTKFSCPLYKGNLAYSNFLPCFHEAIFSIMTNLCFVFHNGGTTIRFYKLLYAFQIH